MIKHSNPITNYLKVSLEGIDKEQLIKVKSTS